ncbi:protein of unknown function [Nitrosotalea devaniterrae]|uniref:Uncharacterized protein n=1 Tax=Nitrosotalea devaniterrae TaxID=1078905 RepID=A0A128A3X7_9ARCH|nr:protein of unknown function [Candidatus Nitrosotalea devanaterra]
MFVISLVTFGISAASFLLMRTYQSTIAGWCAVVFGFSAIITMVIPGLQKLRTGKITKSKV